MLANGGTRMNELQIFENAEFGKVRTIVINHEPWLIGRDIADVLGYSNTRKAIADHVDDEDRGVTKCDTLGGRQEMTIINESGFYSLVMGSKLPTAKRFKRWVTSEVLPSIRKTGHYNVKPIDQSKQMRAEAMLNNSQTRKAKLLYQIATSTTNELYRQAGEALAINLLAGKEVMPLPEAEQRPNHELGYFCKFIGKSDTWATVLGKKLKQAGIEKNAETGVFKVTWDKKNNQRDSFYWFDDVLLPKLAELFPNEYTEVG
jgi:prophage antirepressor-like protein